MRGLTDEERIALIPGSTALGSPELHQRLVERGLLYLAWVTPMGNGITRRHFEPTELGKKALRLDSAARSLGVPA